MTNSLTIIIGWLGISSLAFADLQRYEASQPHMGTHFRIVVYSECGSLADKGLEEAFLRVSKINSLLSDYLPESELSRLSRTSGSGKSVPVSNELWEVLTTADRFPTASGGAFDVTVGLMRGFGKSPLGSKQLPPQGRIERFQESVGYQRIHLTTNPQTIRLDGSEMFLDLGGIAKGYAADQALLYPYRNGDAFSLGRRRGRLGAGIPAPREAGLEDRDRGQVHPEIYPRLGVGQLRRSHIRGQLPIVELLANATPTS